MTRTRWRSALLLSSVTATAVVYLFVQAPPPLAATREEPGTVPIRVVFALLERENDAARALWTSEIVKPGRARGLVFDEHWRDEASASGPLPALFLRETARHLERDAPGLRLFLGSEHPINSANRFTGRQAVFFQRLAETGAPQHFFEPSTALHTAMFADRAVVDACVRCHNEHADSPKKDWELDDIMGATTWMYPEETVTMRRAVELVAALRRSIRAAYASYLAKAATFPEPPRVGDGWPADGLRLPTEDVFMAELARRSSADTLRGLLEPQRAEHIAEAAPPPAPAAEAAPADDVLVIRARQKVRVLVDHAGVQLVAARLREGGMAAVRSPPPLRVRVEQPDAIDLDYRGKPVTPAEVELVVHEAE